ncbi:hypothetical protein GUITHDRAFT_48748, partial [Guillardia theta CCMP2712]
FEAFDLDQDGIISLQDFKVGAQQLQLGLADSDLESWFSCASTNNPNGIIIETWNLLLDDANAEEINIALDYNHLNLNSGFLAFDKDSDSRISLKDLTTSMNELQIHCLDSDISILMTFMDKDKDGYISFDEWRSALHTVYC